MLRDSQFRWSDDDGISRLVVTGEIDLAVLQRFRSALSQMIDGGASPAYVDMTAVTFCDSSGINALVHAQRAAVREGVTLILNPSPWVRRVLQVVNLESEFNTVDPNATASL